MRQITHTVVLKSAVGLGDAWEVVGIFTNGANLAAATRGAGSYMLVPVIENVVHPACARSARLIEVVPGAMP